LGKNSRCGAIINSKESIMTMTAMQILDAPFAMEARVHMDRYDLPPEVFQQVRASIAHKAYLEEIKPFVKQIVAVKSLAMPSYVQHKDGCIEGAGDGLTESMREIVNRHQGWIDEITARYNKMTAQATSAKPPAAPAPCPGSPDTDGSHPQSMAR
jgi:hypothetical protein